MKNPPTKKSIVESFSHSQKLQNFKIDKLVTAASLNIDEKLRKKIPDLTLFDYSDPNTVWCLHIEHQSRNDINIQKRIMDYQIAIGRTYRRSFPDDRRELAISSILFQASKKPYDKRQNIIALIDSNGNVQKIFDVVDLASMTDEKIERIGTGRFVLMPMKYMINDNPTSAYLYIMQNKEQIIQETQDVLMFEMAQNYVLTSLSKYDRMKVIEAAAKYNQNVEEDMETWANSYANEVVRENYLFGLGEGLDKGKMLGLNEGKVLGADEIRLLALREMLKDGVGLQSAMKYLHIPESELQSYISTNISSDLDDQYNSIPRKKMRD